MIRSRTKGLLNAYIIAQSLALVASFWGYLFALDLALGMDLSFRRYVSYSLITLFGLLIHLFGIDLTSTNLLVRDGIRSMRLAVRQAAYVFGTLLFMVLLTKDVTISRLFVVTYIPILIGTFFAINVFVPRWLGQFFFSGRRQTRTILIGDPERIRRIRPWLHDVQNYGIEVIGVVTDANRKTSYRLPVLGRVSELSSLLQTHEVHSVLLLEIPEDRREINRILEACEGAGARFAAVNSLAEVFQHSLRYFHQFGFDFVSLREEPLEDPISRLGKRLSDIIISLPVVLFVLPVLAGLVACIHRRHSPGPLFFRQLRTGIRNQPFEILKFRTMNPHNDDPVRQASASDPRVFPGGQFLRRSSIDEFPQFLNVLRGEMSIVGPRPHMLKHDEQFSAILSSYHVRSFVKPGLTGLAQVRGYRGEAKAKDAIASRIECDIEYIERWSPLLDALIIAKTAWQVIRPPKSAY